MNMKNYLFAVAFAIFFLCVPQQACPQFNKGSVIRLVNKSSGKIAAADASSVRCAERDNSDYSQLWYVEARTYNAIPIGYKVRLRNLSNGCYMQGNDNPSTPWSIVKSSGTYTADNIKYTTELWEASRDGYYTLGAESKKTGDSDYYYDKIHGSADGTCVSWIASADASLWTVELVNGIDVQAQWDKLARFEDEVNRKDEYQSYLNTLFTDNLCVELRDAYKSWSALSASSAYQALPSSLKNMAMKVCNADWAETNRDNGNVSWTGSSAKRFRVQRIEPYSVAEEIAGVVKTGAYSNMNNPTGLYVGDMDMLYVMVKGTVNPGASLSLAVLSHDNKSYLTSIQGSNPVALNTGLNIIPFYGDKKMLYILYAVNSQSSSYPLTNYPDIEVHIEGGSINGMYDSSMDDESRFDELSRNASKAGLEFYDVLGGKFVFHTSWETVFKNNTASSINRALGVWDMIGGTQHMIMGVSSAAETASDPLGLHTYTSDFSRSFNNKQLVHTLPVIGAYTQAPFRIQFAHGEGILQGDVMEKQGYIWGPAHEMGHANQNVINMVGTTEISNNLFSNVAVFYQDYLLSRGGTVADNYDGYKSNTAWHFRNSDSRMRMLYQLWLYYHAAGKNKNFFPKLFESLRNDPMSIYDSSKGDVYTSNESLKFYKYACRAAGEDLSPFFEAWGFFVPFEKTTITDYNTYSVLSRESDIAAARNEVAGYGYKKNYSVIFIEDRIGTVMSKKFPSRVKTWFSEALNTGSMGQYSDYADGVSLSGEYVWMQKSDNIVKVDGGKGAVGIIIEKAGRLLAFGNDSELYVDDETMSAIKTGECIVKVVGADQSMINVKNVSESGNDEAKRAVLESLLGKAEAVSANIDAECRKVGCYSPVYTQGLMLVYEKALGVFNKRVAEEYVIYIEKLTAEIAAVEKMGGNARIGILDGAVYMVENKQYPGYYMCLGNNNEVDGRTGVYNSAGYWTFEQAGTPGTYYIKNNSNNRYVETVNSYSNQVYADKTANSSAGVYPVEIADDGNVLLGDASYCLHLDAGKNVVGWVKTADASYWKLRMVSVNETDAARMDMEVALQGVKWLVEEMAAGAVFGSNPSVTGIKERYIGSVELRELTDACRSVSDALSMSGAESASYKSMSAELKEHYASLKRAYDLANDVGLKAARIALKNGMDEVRGCLSGSAAGTLQLQCSDSSAPNYLSSNAEHNAGGGVKDGGGLPALIDGSEASYFHSRWAGTPVDENHYLQIDMGYGNSISDFCFSYSLRNDAYHAVPAGIVVLGSDNGIDFEQIADLGREELTGEDDGGSASYSLNSNFEAVTKYERKISSVKLVSPGCGEQTAVLDAPSMLYNDLTEIVFEALPGETLTASFVKDGDWGWMNGYIYIDADKNGFDAYIENNNPQGDIVAYSFYGSETNEMNGRNSLGTYISGEGRNVLDPPSFTAPDKPGVYRMRYKADWNSIDPKGDNNSNFGGTIADTHGSIVDVTLRVGDARNATISGSFMSDTISCAKRYRYLRFAVTESDCFVESHNCSSGHLQYNGQYFFCISEFGLHKIDYAETEGTWLPLYEAAAETLLADAEALLDEENSSDRIEAFAAELRLMADTLKRALKTPLPVELTFEEDLPVYYRIISAVGDSPIEYDSYATPNVYDAAAPLNLVTFAGDEGDAFGRAWYFAQGTDVGRYYICPERGDGKVLGANPAWREVIRTGEGRVWGVDKDAPGYITEWEIEVAENGHCVFRPVYATSLVLGRVDANAQKLGFVADASADNAMFIIEEREPGFVGIDDTVHDGYDSNGEIYDIFGRRVKQIVSPGLYISGGKKKLVLP